jgi:uncharacterized protein involved in type VI secretion and phage assembly
MSSAITRDHSLLSMTSPLGRDVLIPTRFTCDEALGEPYLAVVEAVSDRAAIDPAAILYQPVCIALHPRVQEPRYLHGLVRRITATGAQPRHMHGYRLEIVPALWFLSQTEDCRIFEQQTAQDILLAIFREHRLSFSFRVQPPVIRPFTVQYNESDLAFVTRLMEEEGWFYLFQHAADGHTLIIADSNAAFARLKDGTVTQPPMARSPWPISTPNSRRRQSRARPKRPSPRRAHPTATPSTGPPARPRATWPSSAAAPRSKRPRRRRCSPMAAA